MAAPSTSPLDTLPGRFPLCDTETSERRLSGRVPNACRISDPFAAFPQRSYHLSRLMYARRVELMMLRAEAQSQREQRAPNPVRTLLRNGLRLLSSSLNPIA
jgi:hypothetical protein